MEDPLENQKREWDYGYNKWLKAGMPENDPVNPKPGPHPIKMH